jgi:hypothetical protein
MALGHPRDRGADRGGGYRREGLAVSDKCAGGVKLQKGKRCSVCDAGPGDQCAAVALREFENRQLLVVALEGILHDIAEYERINNLAPNPGRTECWDSVAYAKTILAQVKP